MSSLVNRFKAGAGKAAFEADRLRRLQAAQSAVKPLRADAERLFTEMGKLAYLAYNQGALDRPELLTAGDRLAKIHSQIQEAEAEIERIRAEEYVEPLSAAAQSGLICPNGHGSLAGGASFCQVCGMAGVQPAPPPTTAANTFPCRNCKTPLDAAARFCAVCGTPVERCSSCNSILPTDAVFCTECGTPVGKHGADSSADLLNWPEESGSE